MKRLTSREKNRDGSGISAEILWERDEWYFVEDLLKGVLVKC